MSTYASNVAEFRDDVATLSKADKIALTQAAKQESWTDPGVLPATFVNIVGGMTYGMSIGFIPILFTFNRYLADCSRYTTSGACAGMTFANCQWMNSTELFVSRGYQGEDFCAFPDYVSQGVNCTGFVDVDSCANSYGGEACVWSDKTGSCDHVAGWSANQQGLLAGIQIIGSMIASAFAGQVTNKLGRKKALGLSGTIVTLACCLLTIAWIEAEAYFTLFAGELIIGAAGGFLSVISPIYVGEMVTNPVMGSKVGVLFQLSVAFSIAICGGVGLIIDPENDTWQANEYLQQRFLTMVALQWLTAFAVFAVAFLAPESPLWLIRKIQAAGGDFQEEVGCCDDFCPDDEDTRLARESEAQTLLGSKNTHSSEHEGYGGAKIAVTGAHDDNDNQSQASSSTLTKTQRERNTAIRSSAYAASSVGGKSVKGAAGGYKAPSVIGGVVVTATFSSHHHSSREHGYGSARASTVGGATRASRKTAGRQSHHHHAHHHQVPPSASHSQQQQSQNTSEEPAPQIYQRSESSHITANVRGEHDINASFNHRSGTLDGSSPSPDRNNDSAGVAERITAMTSTYHTPFKSISERDGDETITTNQNESSQNIDGVHNNDHDEGYHVERTQSATEFKQSSPSSPLAAKPNAQNSPEGGGGGRRGGVENGGSKLMLKENGIEEEIVLDEEDEEDEEGESDSFSDLFVRENIPHLLVGGVVAAGLQLTGINGVIIYSPSIVAKVGIKPLLGSFMVSLLNFFSALIPIVLVRYFSCRKLFIGCNVLACISGAIAAVGIWPGVFEDESPAQKAVSLFGMGMFIMSFESGIGPCFYVIAQEIFPARVRSLGTSYCVWVAFLFNVLVNYGFPVAVVGLSGGPNANQNKGLAIMFVIFSSVGAFVATFLGLKMQKSKSEE